MVADHVSRFENSDIIRKERNVVEEFLEENMLFVSARPCVADMENFKVENLVPERCHIFVESKSRWVGEKMCRR